MKRYLCDDRTKAGLHSRKERRTAEVGRGTVRDGVNLGRALRSFRDQIEQLLCGAALAFVIGQRERRLRVGARLGGLALPQQDAGRAQAMRSLAWLERDRAADEREPVTGS